MGETVGTAIRLCHDIENKWRFNRVIIRSLKKTAGGV